MASQVESASIDARADAAERLQAGEIDLLDRVIGVITQHLARIMLNASSPGDSVFIETSNRSVSATLGQHPQKPEKAYLGISARPYLVPNEEFVSSYGAWLPPALKWLAGLIFWLFMLNIGIGLFNLLPIGPLDGGRMFQLVCFKLFKRKETALKIWSWVSIFFVVIILANLFVGFIR